MKAYEVVGYTYEGSIYCVNCGNSNDDPIFACHEFDSKQYCDECREELDVNVIDREKEDKEAFSASLANTLAEQIHHAWFKEFKENIKIRDLENLFYIIENKLDDLAE